MRTLYDLTVGQGWVQPGAFWNLCPGELWWLIDAHKPRNQAGSQESFAELYDMLKAAKEVENGER